MDPHVCFHCLHLSRHVLIVVVAIETLNSIITDHIAFLQKLCSFAIDVASSAIPVTFPYVVSPSPSVPIYAPLTPAPPQPSVNGYIVYLTMTLLTSFLLY
jgi:hypothetical protein